MDKPKVFIVDKDYQVDTMFTKKGWKVVSDPSDCDLIQFTGGPDISPSYYKSEKHPKTHSHPVRDEKEFNLYNIWVGKKPMAGICRGGQLLNVANGGLMYQHVDEHDYSQYHFVDSHFPSDNIHKKFLVTSVHHQMMIPTDKAIVLLTADESELRQLSDKVEDDPYPDMFDIEALFYPETSCFCYQPHPEYCQDSHPCQVNYFAFIETLLGIK